MIIRLRVALWFALLAGLAAVLWLRFSQRSEIRGSAPRIPTNALQTLQLFEEQQARLYWDSELVAQKYGAFIEQLWDNLNASADKLEVIARIKPGNITLATYPSATVLPWGIHAFRPSNPKRQLAGSDWREFLRAATSNGWNLAQCEFRHVRFTPASSRKPSSNFYFSAHLTNAFHSERAIIEGDLQVDWDGTPDRAKLSRVDASRLEIRTRSGPIAFRPILQEELQPRSGSYFVDPLIAWDLDHDGSTELILAAANRVYRRDSDGVWNHTPLCDSDPGILFTGALGDFDGNGTIDFLCAKFEGLFLYEGTADGRYPNPPRQVWVAQPHLKYAQALAVGDIDGDGHLDVFLGQYKVPYDKGQMPRPYFDANDGYPYFLLQNDGRGNFKDVTQSAGLGGKRARRVYNASLIDLDHDSHLDLVLVSDFAGLDAFRNDGSGHFKDVTSAWFPTHAALGMGNCFADFNRDGRLDLFLVGMNSPTADRLGCLGLNRPYALRDEGQRSAVTFGNHLLFGTAENRFEPRAVSLAVARTGWSWGSVAADFDNDGFPDLYVANGHESRQSVRDYDAEFWLHDIYVGNSTENRLAHLYFREKMARTRGQGWSYGGYEKNRFFLNLGGTNFVECAFLLGLALESDTRNVLAEDVDGDGRLDLVVTTYEVYPTVRQTLQVFHNDLPVQDRFATLAFRGLDRCGRVFLAETNRADALLSTGSYRSQAQPTLHLKTEGVAEVVSRLALSSREFILRKTPR